MESVSMRTANCCPPPAGFQKTYPSKDYSPNKPTHPALYHARHRARLHCITVRAEKACPYLPWDLSKQSVIMTRVTGVHRAGARGEAIHFECTCPFGHDF